MNAHFNRLGSGSRRGFHDWPHSSQAPAQSLPSPVLNSRHTNVFQFPCPHALSPSGSLQICFTLQETLLHLLIL